MLFKHGIKLGNILNEPQVVCMRLCMESVAHQTDHFADASVREGSTPS